MALAQCDLNWATERSSSADLTMCCLLFIYFLADTLNQGNLQLLQHITLYRYHIIFTYNYPFIQLGFYWSNLGKVPCSRVQQQCPPLGIEPTTLWSRVQSPNHYSTLLPHSTYYSLALSVCLFTIHILKYIFLALFII